MCGGFILRDGADAEAKDLRSPFSGRSNLHALPVRGRAANMAALSSMHAPCAATNSAQCVWDARSLFMGDLLLLQSVDGDGKQQHDAGTDQLPVRGYIEHDQAVVQDGQNQYAHNRSGHISSTA